MKKDKPKKKVLKKIVKPKKVVKEGVKDLNPPYFPPPYFSTNWGGRLDPFSIKNLSKE